MLNRPAALLYDRNESVGSVVSDRERPDWATVLEEELQRVARAMAELPYEQRASCVIHGNYGYTLEVE